MRSDNIFSGDRGRGTPFGVPHSLSKKQYSIFMLRAAARIQSNLLCKFINSGSMAQATLSCRYAAIHLVYLGIYTREEKSVRRTRFFFEIRSKAWFRARGCSENKVFRQSQAPSLLIKDSAWAIRYTISESLWFSPAREGAGRLPAGFSHFLSWSACAPAR